MIEISKEKYNYCYVEYADVNVGDTFVDDSGNIYIKIPVVFKFEAKDKYFEGECILGEAVAPISQLSQQVEYSCVSLRDGKLQKFLDKTKVYLVNCKMKWDYNRAEKKKQCE